MAQPDRNLVANVEGEMERGWILLDSKGKRASGFYLSRTLLYAVFDPHADAKGFEGWLKERGYRIVNATLTWETRKEKS